MTDARARSGAGNGEDPDVPPDGYPGEQPRDGRVVVFLGVAGGVGTTTLCANTAQALGALGRTLILDLAWPLGGLGHLLSAPTLPGIERLTNGLSGPECLERQLAGGDGTGLRFRFLTGYHDFNPTEHANAGPQPLIRSARALADYVLVDLGSPAGPYASCVAESADLAVVTMALERTQLAQARALLRWLDELGLSKNRRVLVGNRLRPSLLGLREAQRCLGEGIFLIVPNESDRLAQCLNEGRLLISQHPDSAGAVAIAELAAALNRQLACATPLSGEVP
ncbi:MAG: AAA family ATPase [Anaerolineae bacterium]